MHQLLHKQSFICLAEHHALHTRMMNGTTLKLLKQTRFSSVLTNINDSNPNKSVTLHKQTHKLKIHPSLNITETVAQHPLKTNNKN